MKARDIMTTNLVTINQNADLDWTSDVMEIANIRHIPVVSGEKLVGLISHRDLLRSMISTLARLDSDEERELMQSIPAKQVMSSDLTTIGPDEDLRGVIELMIENKFDCLPVVDEGKLVGIITSHDIMRLSFDFVTMEDFPWSRIVSANESAGGPDEG